MFVLLLLMLAACGPSAAEAPPTATDAPAEVAATPTPDSGLACETVVQDAIAVLDETCADTGRNEACYGHDQITASLRPDAAASFAAAGDRVALADLLALTTSPYDPASAAWGVALLRVQADLPDALPGQAVTFIAYGEASIEQAAESEAPMQTVYIRTGFGNPACEDAADSGVLIQNDSGAVASLTVNGVDLAVGSTVLVQAQPDADMVLAVLEGQVDAVALGERVTAIAGGQVRVALGGANRLEAVALPVLERLDTTTLELRNLRGLLQRLPEQFTLPTPLQDLDFDVLPLLDDLNLGQPGPGIQITPPRARD